MLMVYSIPVTAATSGMLAFQRSYKVLSIPRSFSNLGAKVISLRSHGHYDQGFFLIIGVGSARKGRLQLTEGLTVTERHQLWRRESEP